MIALHTTHGSRHCDGLSRREWLRVGALGVGGLALPDLLRLQETAAATDPPARGSARARSVIVLFLSGGPSHLDMWDLKPDAPAEIRGTFRPIDTNVPGVRISEEMPRLARQADRFALLRSVSHPNGNHPAATYWMMIGMPMTRPAPQVVTMSREDRPHVGSALARLLPNRPGLPPFVMVPEAISPVGPERPGQHAGFLGAAYDPYRVNSDPNSPQFSPGALYPRNGPARLHDRQSLLRQLDRQARHLEASAAAQTLNPYFTRAFDLISSPAAQRAFDLGAEPANVRDRYGRHIFGQSVLLARRLVEAGVRLVHVNWVRHDNGSGGQGYDSHRDHLNWCRQELLPPTDAACAALLQDLADRGLLDETIVLVLGEFGRTPRFNRDGGRDHWPNCFSVLMAGGGIRGGQVVGSSDRIGAFPTSAPISPADIFATVYDRLGVDPHTVIYDQTHRPHFLVEGTPLRI
jgi:hypothetical protein